MAIFVPKYASQIKNVPAGNISATDVQSAINELDDEKQAVLGYTPENIANKGQANGYCPLDSNSLIPLSNIPQVLTGKDADTVDGYHQNQSLLFTDTPTFAGLNLSNLTSGSILFVGSGGSISQDNSRLFWDNASKRLGIGLSAPTAKLDIVPESSSEVVFRTKSLQSTAPLGSELVTNGTFDSSSGWNWGTGWSWDEDNKEADHATGNTAALTQSISVVNGTTYHVEITIRNRTTGSVSLDINGVYIYNFGSYASLDGNTTYKRSLVANITGSATLSVTPTSDFNGSVDNISVRAITSISQPNMSLIDDVGSIVIEMRGKSSLSNIAIGVGALRFNATGSYNSAMGANALYSNTTGINNSAMGHNVLYSNTTGSYNSAIGREALRFNTTGSSNSAMGFGAIYSNTTGYDNSAIGREALRSNTTGYSNSAVGAFALQSNTTGSNNIAVGNIAGGYISGGGANQTSNNSVYLGYDTRALANGDTNEIVIGYQAIGNGSNSVTLGNNSITKTILKGSIGIGTSAPTAKLHVIGSTGYNQLRLQTSYTPSGTSDSNGYDGDIAWDDSYIYVKTSSGWKRAELSTF